jgi:hypothetical protein
MVIRLRLHLSTEKLTVTNDEAVAIVFWACKHRIRQVRELGRFVAGKEHFIRGHGSSSLSLYERVDDNHRNRRTLNMLMGTWYGLWCLVEHGLYKIRELDRPFRLEADHQ